MDDIYHGYIGMIEADRKLSQVDRLLFLFLLRACLESPEHSYHQTNREIAARTGLAVATVHRGIGALADAGYISASHRRRRIGGAPIWYISIPQLESPAHYFTITDESYLISIRILKR
jgi:IclR-like helix-turn-helix domain-containing protein